MSCTVSVSKLQAETPKILRETAERGFTSVTRHGEMVAILLSRDRLESILETIELQQNRELMELVRLDKAGKLKYLPFDEDKD
jgi:PHD/YefM family antitoxin component YafN of YafNO toxin-antitoxin module